MKYLSDFDGVRENNFTALRLLFAWLVLFGHSYLIANPSVYDPVSAYLVPYGWLGSIAVSGFFAISGFLVTASFIQRGPVNFVASRVLRLYPCVIVYSLLMIFVLGPLAKSVDFSTYWKAEPWNNMWNSLLWSWQYNLPYVFADNPFKGSTNSSTWTLPVELRCYIGILFLGLAGTLKENRTANFALFLLLFAVVWNFDVLPFFNETYRVADPLLFFIMGSLAWINRQHIPLSGPLALAALIMPFLLATTDFYEPVYVTCFSYVIFYAAYRLPHVNVDRFGDISYGLYLYAWPIQQLVWYPGQGGLRNAVYATAITVPLAYLSWRLIEKPALGLRKLLGGRRPLRKAQSQPAPATGPIQASGEKPVVVAGIARG